MRSYFGALRKYTQTHFGEAEVVGAGAAAAPARSTDEELRGDLKAISEKDGSYFKICVAMILFLFIASFALVILKHSDPNAIKVIFAVTGISLTGLVKQMISLWKEKVHSDMVLILASKLAPEDLRAIVNVLLTEKV